MAILWQYQDPNTQVRYEVRTAGSSVRLYTNGAFHSQYSPKHLFTGAIWDALSLPALFTGEADNRFKSKKALVLGVGGGTVIHQLCRLLNLKQITGIELDPIHIQVAQEYFMLQAPNIELIEADAFTWVRSCRKRFDIVVDDLFLHLPVGNEGDPVRPFSLDDDWLGQLNRKVSIKGLLIQNHLSAKSAKAFAMMARQHFSSALVFRVKAFENAVLALYRSPTSATSNRARILRQIEQTNPGSTKKLRFSVRQLY